MSDSAPEDWKRLPLKDVAALQRGFDLPLKSRRLGNIPVYGSNGIDGWHDRAMVVGPGVVTGRSGTIGSVHYEMGDFWPLNTALYVRDFHGNSSSFVARLLEFLDLKRFSASTGVPSLNRNFVHPFPVLVPPFCEQEKISEVLDAADEAIAKTDALIAKLKAIKQGLMHDLLTRGLDHNGEMRDSGKNPQQFKKTTLGLLPDAWDTPTISELAVHVGSGITPAGGSNVYKREGILFIRSQNVAFDRLLLQDIAYIDERMHRMMARSEVFAHDVLLNITGASIGRCCPVPEGLGRANVNQHVCAIGIEGPRREDAVYLSAVLASFIVQNQIDRLNAGSNRQGLNYRQLRSCIVPWPMDKAERDTAAAKIVSTNARIEFEEAYLSKLKVFKKGLMQDLLTGRVRVPKEMLKTEPTS